MGMFTRSMRKSFLGRNLTRETFRIFSRKEKWGRLGSVVWTAEEICDKKLQRHISANARTEKADRLRRINAERKRACRRQKATKGRRYV